MWWKAYGFSENPLDIRPSYNVYGLDDQKREIERAIINGEMFLVYGPMGAGKTSLAFSVKKALEDKGYKFIYLNGEENRFPDVNTIVRRAKERKLFGIIRLVDSRKIVLVLDELQNFDPEVLKQAKALYDKKWIHSLFMIQIKEEIENATPSMINRVSRKIFVDFPKEETIKKIVKDRLGGKIEIDDELLKEIIALNKRNVRSILLYLSKLLEEIENHPIKKLEKKYSIPVSDLDYEEAEDIEVSPQQEYILEKLINRRLTIKQISELTGIAYNTVSKQVSRLVEKGILLKTVEDGKVLYEIHPMYLKAVLKRLGK